MTGLLTLCFASAAAHEGRGAQMASIDAGLAADPQSVTLHLARAELLQQEDRWEESARELQWLTDRVPEDPALLYPRALARRALGEFASAEEDLTRLLAVSPTAKAWTARAEVRAMMGQARLAREDHTAAIAVGPTPDRYLARADHDLALGDSASALAGLKEGITRLHGAVVLRLRWIEIQQDLGEHQRALDEVDRLLLGAPEHPDWLLLRATSLEALDLHEQAQTSRLAALQVALAGRQTASRRLTAARAVAALGGKAAAEQLLPPAQLQRLAALGGVDGP